MCTNQSCVFNECNLCNCSDCANFSVEDKSCTFNSKILGESKPCKYFVSSFVPLAGASEAAEILGWDRRKVSTYYGRHILPDPIAILASGPIWTRRQIEQYRDELQAKKQHSK